MPGLLKQVNLILINILTGASVAFHLIFFLHNLQPFAMHCLLYQHASTCLFALVLAFLCEHLNGSECRHQIIM